MANSTRKTGNEPVAGIDAGGTRPAKGKFDGSPATKQEEQRISHAVQSGDRNHFPKRGATPKS